MDTQHQNNLNMNLEASEGIEINEQPDDISAIERPEIEVEQIGKDVSIEIKYEDDEEVAAVENFQQIQIPRSFSQQRSGGGGGVLQAGKSESQLNNSQSDGIISGREQAYISHKLASLGYDIGMIERLINQKGLNMSIEQAVIWLNKDDAGKWGHTYASSQEIVCKICLESSSGHAAIEDDTKFKPKKGILKFNQQKGATCGICYSALTSPEEVIILFCGHAYCDECLRAFVNFEVSIAKVQGGICCPDVVCSANGDQISSSLLKRHLMSAETYQKYQKFTRRLEIYRDPSLKGCPTVDCEGFLKKPQTSEQYPNYQAPSICCICQKGYCFKCLHLWHPSETCEEKIDKGYEEWAQPNSENVGTCKNCGIKIEKEGGCPHMICQICKHEWCWICKEDFPVHTPQCPNYENYLEILAFQGVENSFEGDQTIHQNGWFMYSGGSGNLCFYLSSVLFLLLVGTPCIAVFNVFVTPVYMLAFIFRCMGMHRSSLNGRFWIVSFLVLAFLLLYLAVPVVFFMVTMPQLTFHFTKKCLELKDLCKHRCRRYRKLSIAPVNNRLLRFIGLH